MLELLVHKRDAVPILFVRNRLLAVRSRTDCFRGNRQRSTMEPLLQLIALVALAALPIACAITPEAMLAAPRRGVALANPSGVDPILAQQE